MSQTLCMIGGTGRSGTTVLHRIFHTHPAFPRTPELRFLIDPDGVLDFYQSLSSQWSPFFADQRIRRFEALLRDIRKPEYWSFPIRLAMHKKGFHSRLPGPFWRRYSYLAMKHYAPHYDEFVERLMTDLKSFTYQGEWLGMGRGDRHRVAYASPFEREELAAILRTFYLSVTDDIAKRQGAQKFLGKEPYLLLYLDLLLELVPETRFVHIYRDPRDVVASMTKQGWAPNDPLQSARIYMDIMDRWIHIRKSISPENFHEVRFEDLVRTPRPILEELCKYWDIQWNDCLLELPLKKHNMGRWKTQFDKNIREQISELLDPYVLKFGYPL